MENDKQQALQILFGSIIDEMKDSSAKKLEEITKSVEDKAEALEKKMSDSLKRLDDIISNKPITVNFGTPQKPQNEIVHKSFDKILKVLQSTKRKEKHIMLVGGDGGGKTHLAGQVAKALGIQFYPMSVGLQTTKSDLLGFINATGGYMTSPVREAYEKGGLLLLDEFDATHAGVVTILNSLLANGHATFPDKIVEKNEKFVCMCACNTYGRGGNIDYIGRNKLDGATLDRFIIIDVDYDKQLERELADNDTWVDVVEKVRENIKSQGIKMIISPRASMDGADLLEAGFNVSEVMDMVIFKGCDSDIRTKISKGISLSSVRKRPHRKKDEPYAEEPKPEEITEDKMIYVNFDENKYSVKGFTTMGGISWKSSFTIMLGENYTTGLTKDILYLNKQHETPADIDFVSEEAIDHFIRSMQKWGSKCPETFLMTIVYKGTTQYIHMGE